MIYIQIDVDYWFSKKKIIKCRSIKYIVYVDVGLNAITINCSTHIWETGERENWMCSYILASMGSYLLCCCCCYIGWRNSDIYTFMAFHIYYTHSRWGCISTRTYYYYYIGGGNGFGTVGKNVVDRPVSLRRL